MVSPYRAACTTRNGSQDGSYSVLPQPAWREEKWENWAIMGLFEVRSAASMRAQPAARRGRLSKEASRHAQPDWEEANGGWKWSAWRRAQTLSLSQPFQVERPFTR